MNQETAFCPHVYVQTLDGTLIAFARAKSKTIAKMAAKMKAVRDATVLADLEKDKTLKPIERAELRNTLTSSIVTMNTAADRCVLDADWCEDFLLECAVAAGEDRDKAVSAIDLIPWALQSNYADALVMMPVVTNEQVGTKANPLKPGIDRSSGQNTPDTTGASSAAPQAESSESTPANTLSDTSTK